MFTKLICRLLPLGLVLHSTLAAQDLIPLDSELRKTWPNNRTVNIVFHGHSVPSGYHLTPLVKPYESYPHLLRQKLAARYPFAVFNVITTSIGGENSIAGAARFNADVLPHKPDLIFIDYAINDRSQPLASVESAWRSMINAAKAANVPVVLITPTGTTDSDFSNSADALTERADLIRSLATSEGVLIADVSAAWLAALNSGTPQANLLSQGNHPNLAGHQIAADTLFATFSAATATTTTQATAFPRNSTDSSFTTTDSKATFNTSGTFSGQGDYLGDSGGSSDLAHAYNGSETLEIALAPTARLNSFALRNTEATITITGFLSDPTARIGTVNNAPGTVTWSEPTKTLTLAIPWDNNILRPVTFTNPAATLGRTLNFAFSNNGARPHQAAFTSFTHQVSTP